MNLASSLLVFTSITCNACHDVHIKLKQLVESKYPDLKFIEINIQKNPKAAADFRVFSAPTVLLYFDNKEYQRFAGIFPIYQVDEAIERLHELKK